MNLSNGSMQDKVVVVTGASAGAGRATAIEFATRGAKVALIARGPEGLYGAARGVEAAGGQALVLPTDVADHEALEQAAARVEAELGPIDVWVNNAMVSVFSPVKLMEPAEFKRVTEVTYLGYVYGTLAALKRMLPRDRGVIVQVGSALAYRGIPLQAAYCAAKHAVQGFHDSLRTELLHDGSNVRVTMVQLPALNTPQFTWVKSRLPNKAQPVPPIYAPEVAARAIVWAAEHDRREVSVGLSTLVAIYGDKIAPGIADWRLSRTGYDAQQTAEPDDPWRPHNLWDPVREDRGVAGPFVERAQNRSLQFWVSTHPVAAAAVAGLTIAVAKRLLR
ncbi:MAG TPA: SDR family oxidoreductase [Chloroflexia bacterium]|nr:SDR family oxidoreductase [Chloroflexia bacterium]